METIDFTKLYKRLKTYSQQSIVTFEKGKYVERGYGTLHDEVEAIMARMSKAGVQPGMRLGLISENRYEWLLYDWAMAALDCVSVIFLEDDVARGLQNLMKEYELSLIVITRRLVNTDLSEGLLVLDEVASPSEKVFPLPESSLKKREDELSNCFSTGTAGFSKGIIVSAQGLATLVNNCLDLYGIGEGDRILVFMPLTAFQQRLFTYAGLLKGLTIIMVKPIHLFHAMRDQSPTILIGPPSLFEAIHDQAMPANPLLANLVKGLNVSLRFAPQALARIIGKKVYGKLHLQFGGRAKILLCGMAKTSPKTLRFFKDAGLPLFEVYGLSETGLVCANTPANDKIGSVGKAFVGAEVRVADDGEVMVKKATFLSRGYFQGIGTLREPHWFGEWYATGDIGSLDQDGFLTLSGRKDNIFVSATGHNIQPEVLEMKLESLVVVKRAVVFGKADQPTLKAVLELNQERTPELEAQLSTDIAKLNQTLEKWCEIGAVVYSEMPFSPENGLLNRGLKINRKKVYETFKSQLEAVKS